MARQVWTGAAFPLRCCFPAGRAVTLLAVARLVASFIRTVPGAAALCSLEAVFMMSPAIMP